MQLRSFMMMDLTLQKRSSTKIIIMYVTVVTISAPTIKIYNSEINHMTTAWNIPKFIKKKKEHSWQFQVKLTQSDVLPVAKYL